MSPPAQGSSHRASPKAVIHRRLRYHEKKLLRKHDFLNYETDLWHETYCIRRYNLTEREDYRHYLRLLGLIRSLMAQLRQLPADSKIRIEITEQLTRKLYDMGLLRERLGLGEVDKLSVEDFCRRRLPMLLVARRMAGNARLASDTVRHGHVRVGLTQVRDTAMIVPRALEDRITWMTGSRIRAHIAKFQSTYDDLDGGELK